MFKLKYILYFIILSSFTSILFIINISFYFYIIFIIILLFYILPIIIAKLYPSKYNIINNNIYNDHTNNNNNNNVSPKSKNIKTIAELSKLIIKARKLKHNKITEILTNINKQYYNNNDINNNNNNNITKILEKFPYIILSTLSSSSQNRCQYLIQQYNHNKILNFNNLPHLNLSIVEKESLYELCYLAKAQSSLFFTDKYSESYLKNLLQKYDIIKLCDTLHNSLMKNNNINIDDPPLYEIFHPLLQLILKQSQSFTFYNSYNLKSINSRFKAERLMDSIALEIPLSFKKLNAYIYAHIRQGFHI